MVTITVHGTVEPFCCWLRPAPNIDINLHCTFDKILEAVNLQQWYPLNCHYCGFRPRHVDDFETHIVKNHPGKTAYPGPTPVTVARALYIVESIEKELKDRKTKNQQKQQRENGRRGRG